MKPFLYSRCNWKRMAPLCLCTFLSLAFLMALNTLNAAIVVDKERYAEVYRHVRLLQSTSTNLTEPPSLAAIPIGVSGIGVKLVFGTDSAVLFTISKSDLVPFLQLLGITEKPDAGATLLSHVQVMAAAQAGGTWHSTSAGTYTWLFHSGPACVIRIAPLPPQDNTWLLPANSTYDKSLFTVTDYNTVTRRISRENSFLSTVTLLLSSVVGLILLVATTGLIWSIMRSRRPELAILRIIGHHRTAIAKIVFSDVGTVLAIGTIFGCLLGWLVGCTLVNTLSPAGLRLFWPKNGLWLMLFPAALLAAAFFTTWQAMNSFDPIGVVEREQEVA